MSIIINGSSRNSISIGGNIFWDTKSIGALIPIDVSVHDISMLESTWTISIPAQSLKNDVVITYTLKCSYELLQTKKNSSLFKGTLKDMVLTIDELESGTQLNIFDYVENVTFAGDRLENTSFPILVKYVYPNIVFTFDAKSPTRQWGAIAGGNEIFMIITGIYERV
jgi:hypothetical protein